MVKLYKNIDGKLFYVEYWINKNLAVVHSGVIGNNGNTRESICDNPIEFEKSFKKNTLSKGTGKFHIMSNL